MRTLILALLSAFLSLPVAAEPLTWQWEPATGPVASYDVIASRNGEGWRLETSVTEPQVTLDVPDGESAVILVQARSEDGRAGPYSIASEVGRRFPDPAPIGTPGEPVRITIEGTMVVE